MTLQEFIDKDINEIVAHPQFVKAETENTGGSKYWKVTMKGEKKEAGYFFMEKPLMHELCIFFKLITL